MINKISNIQNTYINKRYIIKGLEHWSKRMNNKQTEEIKETWKMCGIISQNRHERQANKNKKTRTRTELWRTRAGKCLIKYNNL